MSFLYETHMHTCTGSACGRSTGREHVHFYRDQGFTGIIMTDHFYHGNTAPSRELPWDQYIDAYCRGYEEAKEEGDKVGLDVFFGIEENFQGDEYLIYGVDKAFLKAHPDMKHWTRRQMLTEIHQAGGCVIQAHPFRMRDYMDIIRLGLLFCDGIEVANAGNHDPMEDVRAMRYGRDLNLVLTAGSDNHHSPQPCLFGVELENRLTCIEDYVRVILNREPIGLHVPPERFRPLPDWQMEQKHIAWMLDEREQIQMAEKQYI